METASVRNCLRCAFGEGLQAGICRVTSKATGYLRDAPLGPKIQRTCYDQSDYNGGRPEFVLLEDTSELANCIHPEKFHLRDQRSY